MPLCRVHLHPLVRPPVRRVTQAPMSCSTPTLAFVDSRRALGLPSFHRSSTASTADTRTRATDLVFHLSSTCHLSFIDRRLIDSPTHVHSFARYHLPPRTQGVRPFPYVSWLGCLNNGYLMIVWVIDYRKRQ
jgi:hypothetical protein